MSIKHTPEDLLVLINKDDSLKSEIFTQILYDFVVGQIVFHDTFGKGKVLNVYGSGKDARVTIKFNTEKKKLLAGLAKLRGFKI